MPWQQDSFHASYEAGRQEHMLLKQVEVDRSYFRSLQMVLFSPLGVEDENRIVETKKSGHEFDGDS